MNTADLGREAYAAYHQCAHGRSLVTNAPLPPWEELRPPIQAAWMAAAIAVSDLVRTGASPLLGPEADSKGQPDR